MHTLTLCPAIATPVAHETSPDTPALRDLGRLLYRPGDDATGSGAGYSLIGSDGETIASGRHLCDLIHGLAQVRPWLPGIPRSNKMIMIRSGLLMGADAYMNEGESLSQFIAVAVRAEVDRRREREIAELERIEREAVEESKKRKRSKPSGPGWQRFRGAAMHSTSPIEVRAPAPQGAYIEIRPATIQAIAAALATAKQRRLIPLGTTIESWAEGSLLAWAKRQASHGG